VHVHLKGRDTDIVHRPLIEITFTEFTERVAHVKSPSRDLGYGFTTHVADTFVARKSFHTICIFRTRVVLLSRKLTRPTGSGRTPHSLISTSMENPTPLNPHQSPGRVISKDCLRAVRPEN